MVMEIDWRDFWIALWILGGTRRYEILIDRPSGAAGKLVGFESFDRFPNANFTPSLCLITSFSVDHFPN